MEKVAELEDPTSMLTVMRMMERTGGMDVRWCNRQEKKPVISRWFRQVG